MNNSERQNFINFIAADPLNGDLIQGTGGARKIRWQSDTHRGKSGGVRIIYYYHSPAIPIFLFTAYKKNQKENLTNTEKVILYKIIKMITAEYER